MWVNVCGIIEMRRWISTCQLFCCENHNAPKVWHNLKARNLHPAMPKFQQVAMIWVYLQDCIPSHRFWSSLILGHFLWTNHFPKLSEFHWGSWYVKDWPFVSGASMDATATAGQSLFLFRPLTSRSATLLIMSSLNCKKPKPLGSSRPSAVWVVGVWSPNEEVQLVTSWWICFALLPNSSIVEGWSATEQTPLEVKFGWLWIICIHHFTRIAQEIVLMFADEVNGSTSWGVLLPTRSCLAGERLTHRGWSPSKTHWAWCSGVASLNKLPNPNKSQCCKAKPTLWHSQTQALRCFQFSAWKELGWIFLIFSYLLACSTVEGMPWKTLGCLCTGLWAIPMTSATTSHEAIGATWNLFFFLHPPRVPWHLILIWEKYEKWRFGHLTLLAFFPIAVRP